jgi:hypothetical protein
LTYKVNRQIFERNEASNQTEAAAKKPPLFCQAVCAQHGAWRVSAICLTVVVKQ